uniref:Chloroplast polyprotein of elongation factor Ts n=1 Tax=Chlamydomonas reinhardtii TaxID=3055 RepID=Q5QEB0_CHLRE|nr:chloroplast polyprotein of elongation factor Ts precursor [Chlamydomonas reinhardtii]
MLRELGRTATVKAHGRSVLRPVRGPAGRRQVAFTGVRPSVRVFAEAPAAEQAAKAIKLEDVKEGSEYEGTVTTVEEFGAFVNFGANTNGLVHISKLASGFTKNAKDVVQPGQKVTVKVLSVDAEKKRVSLELKSAVAAEASAEESDDIITEPDREGADATDDDEDVEVELEDGQVEVRADLPGFEDIPFVMEEADMDAEMSEAAIAALEADLDGAEIRYELEAPAYMEEVTGKVARIEDYGVFLEFEWNGKTLTGLLAKDEMKVPSSALSAEAQAALRAEWADTGFEMPAFVELPDDELDVKKYYQPGESVPAFVLESSLVDGRGISLTHFTDKEVSAEAVAAYEELEDDEDEELDKMMADAAGLEDEVLAFDPEALMEEDEGEEAGAAADAGDDAEYEGVSADGLEGANGNYALGATRSGLIKGKNGYQVAPMGLPSRPLNDAVTSSGLAILGTSEVDFDGDEVQLVDYWTSEAFDNIPKDVLKKLGLKMSYTEAGEAEFEERADFEATDVPFYLYGGDVESRAKEFVADLLSDDVDEAELPARAGRAPIVLAAAVQNISAAEVKALREKTGAGMMDCKKALAECAGDAEAAAEVGKRAGFF